MEFETEVLQVVRGKFGPVLRFLIPEDERTDPNRIFHSKPVLGTRQVLPILKAIEEDGLNVFVQCLYFINDREVPAEVAAQIVGFDSE